MIHDWLVAMRLSACTLPDILRRFEKNKKMTKKLMHGADVH